VDFINRNKGDIVAGRRLGVERICSVLQVAPSTYYAANGRPASARQVRDAEIAPQLLEIWGCVPLSGGNSLHQYEGQCC